MSQCGIYHDICVGPDWLFVWCIIGTNDHLKIDFFVKRLKSIEIWGLCIHTKYKTLVLYIQEPLSKLQWVMLCFLSCIAIQTIHTSTTIQYHLKKVLRLTMHNSLSYPQYIYTVWKVTCATSWDFLG